MSRGSVVVARRPRASPSAQEWCRLAYPEDRSTGENAHRKSPFACSSCSASSTGARNADIDSPQPRSTTFPISCATAHQACRCGRCCISRSAGRCSPRCFIRAAPGPSCYRLAIPAEISKRLWSLAQFERWSCPAGSSSTTSLTRHATRRSLVESTSSSPKSTVPGPPERLTARAIAYPDATPDDYEPRASGPREPPEHVPRLMFSTPRRDGRAARRRAHLGRPRKSRTWRPAHHREIQRKSQRPATPPVSLDGRAPRGHCVLRPPRRRPAMVCELPIPSGVEDVLRAATLIAADRRGAPLKP